MDIDIHSLCACTIISTRKKKKRKSSSTQISIFWSSLHSTITITMNWSLSSSLFSSSQECHYPSIFRINLSNLSPCLMWRGQRPRLSCRQEKALQRETNSSELFPLMKCFFILYAHRNIFMPPTLKKSKSYETVLFKIFQDDLAQSFLKLSASYSMVLRCFLTSIRSLTKC